MEIQEAKADNECKRLTIHTDSEYARNAILGNKRPKKNTLIIKNTRVALRELRAKLGHEAIRIEWVKAHNGHERNERADKLADWGANQCY